LSDTLLDKQNNDKRKNGAAEMEASIENEGEPKPSFKGKRRSGVELGQDDSALSPPQGRVVVDKPEREELIVAVMARVSDSGKPINRRYALALMPQVLTPERAKAIRELLARGPIEFDDYLSCVAEIIKTYPVPGSR